MSVRACLAVATLASQMCSATSAGTTLPVVCCSQPPTAATPAEHFHAATHLQLCAESVMKRQRSCCLHVARHVQMQVGRLDLYGLLVVNRISSAGYWNVCVPALFEIQSSFPEMLCSNQNLQVCQCTSPSSCPATATAALLKSFFAANSTS
jgi:hypothetical protein